MKSLINATLTLLLSIVLLSCSNDDTNELFEAEPAALKSYTLSRAEDGSYSLNQSLSEGFTSTLISENGNNEIILNEGYSESNEVNAVLGLVNNEIKIDFVTENAVEIPGISIFDTEVNTNSSVSAKKIDYVTSYDISLLEDGSYQLNFSLTKNVYPTFEYNQELERHQIRLNDGKAKEGAVYSQNYTKFEGQKLNIVFVRRQLVSSISAKRANDYEDTVEPPEFEIDN